MRLLRGIGKWIWRFMVIFSFIVNFVLIAILLVAGLFIFQIKAQVADPLIGGLHSTAAGLNNATIDWTIPVRDRIPVVLDIPLQQDTTVVLTAPVPLSVSASIDLPGLNAAAVPATVRITLPEGLSLPVALDLNVPVDQELDVALDVRAVIPVSETQLADPIGTLGLLFEPLAIGLHNLPNNFGEAGQFVGAILNRDANTPWADHLSNLLLSTEAGAGFNEEAYDPWIGYSRTAGLDYNLNTENFVDANEPMETGLIPPGGIPSLDASLDDRAAYYIDDGNPDTRDNPERLNEDRVDELEASNIPHYTWDGTYNEEYLELQGGSIIQPFAPRSETQQVDGSGNNEEVPPPTVSGSDISTPMPAVGGNEGLIPTPSSP